MVMFNIKGVQAHVAWPRPGLYIDGVNPHPQSVAVVKSQTKESTHTHACARTHTQTTGPQILLFFKL